MARFKKWQKQQIEINWEKGLIKISIRIVFYLRLPLLSESQNGWLYIELDKPVGPTVRQSV